MAVTSQALARPVVSPTFLVVGERIEPNEE
jgi:hypothetical protein